jgi:hypothetical protein
MVDRDRQRCGAGQVTDYLGKLMEAGEKDTQRLTVCGLTYCANPTAPATR